MTAKKADVLEIEELEEAPVVKVGATEPIIVAPVTKSAKIKGTWTQYFGPARWDFVDGNRYDLPLDLYNYLKNSGNIYDTL